MTTAASLPPRERRVELDWLRLLAIVLLQVFHSAMPFVAEWDWHIRNAETSNLLLELNFFLSRWRMPLLFLLSGAGTAFALGFRSGGGYARERLRRLGLPLLFGILVIVPPQIWFERLADGVTWPSYLGFWATVLEGRPYPEGSTSWHHLWFVGYLLIYSLASLPLLLWLRTPRGSAAADRAVGMLRGWGVLLPAVPLAIAFAGMIQRWPGPQNIVDDWAMFTCFWVFFLTGFLLGRRDAAWEALADGRRIALGVAVVGIVLLDAGRWNQAVPAPGYSVARLAWLGLYAATAWAWVAALAGYARRYLSRVQSPVLAYANEALYPFYILHQTVIVVIAYYVVQTQESILAKFLFTLVVSGALSVLIYHCFIRPSRWLRPLFGLKPLPVARGWAGREGRANAAAT